MKRRKNHPVRPKRPQTKTFKEPIDHETTTMSAWVEVQIGRNHLIGVSATIYDTINTR